MENNMTNKKQVVIPQNVCMPCWCGGNEEIYDVWQGGEIIRSFILCEQCGGKETFYRKEGDRDTESEN